MAHANFIQCLLLLLKLQFLSGFEILINWELQYMFMQLEMEIDMFIALELRFCAKNLLTNYSGMKLSEIELK